MGEKDYIEQFYKKTGELVERTGDRDDQEDKEKEKFGGNVVDTIDVTKEGVEKAVEEAKRRAEKNAETERAGKVAKTERA